MCCCLWCDPPFNLGGPTVCRLSMCAKPYLSSHPDTSCSKPAFCSLWGCTLPTTATYLRRRANSSYVVPILKETTQRQLSVSPEQSRVSASAGDKITASGQEAARASRELRTYSESCRRWTYWDLKTMVFQPLHVWNPTLHSPG